MDMSTSGCVILVTGASGFLGQHVMYTLSKHADHVTEIRVLDKTRYENKTVSPMRKPVRQYVGDILDETLVTQACHGVDSVIHLAGVIDLNIQPDIDTSHLINVHGTRILLEISKKSGVRRFIYASATAVVVGLDTFDNGTEESLPYPPRQFLSSAYGRSKYEAEKLVLEATGDGFKTLTLRSGILYGEHDKGLDSRVSKGWFRNTYLPEVYYATAHDWVYAGNMAWALYRGERSLYQGATHGVSGGAYFINDDTPSNNNIGHYSVLEVCCEEAGLQPVIPLPIFRLAMFVIRLVLYCCFCFLVNVLQTKTVTDVWKLVPFRELKYRTVSCKAEQLLGYKPLYTFNEAKQRTTAYVRALL